MTPPTPRPEPKFKEGQIVVLRNPRRKLPFRIQKVIWGDEAREWFYAWNRSNYAAEHMIRALTDEEIGK